MAMAASRSRIGSLRLAKIVPDVTLNWARHPAHFHSLRVVMA
jgi:hypothetical protein